MNAIVQFSPRKATDWRRRRRAFKKETSMSIQRPWNENPASEMDERANDFRRSELPLRTRSKLQLSSAARRSVAHASDELVSSHDRCRKTRVHFPVAFGAFNANQTIAVVSSLASADSMPRRFRGSASFANGERIRAANNGLFSALSAVSSD